VADTGTRLYRYRTFQSLVVHRTAAMTSTGRELSVAMSPSVWLSSVHVCNVRATYSAGWNFRQFFFALWYFGYSLISLKILRRSGDLNAREVAKYSDFDIWNAITPKRCNIGCKLVLITNRKSYMGFRLVPISVTLNDLELRNGPYFALFYRIW